mgnify:CR=1 FL=1
MMRHIHALGRATLDIVSSIGRAGLFLIQSIVCLPSREGFHLWVRQMHFVGVMSGAIVLVSGLFIGMVLALQGFTILVGFGADEALGQMVALSLVRELAPVVAALLFIAVLGVVTGLGCVMLGDRPLVVQIATTVLFGLLAAVGLGPVQRLIGVLQRVTLRRMGLDR